MNEKKKKVVKIILLRDLRNKLRRKNREFYIRPLFTSRTVLGESLILHELRNDPFYHNKYFRMNTENFEMLLENIRSKIQGAPSHALPITPLEKLAITLRYLASGNSQVSLGLSYRISPSSVCGILRQTMEAICHFLSPVYLPAPTQEIWSKTEEGFALKWNFPNCCGAIDGKHVRIIKAPYCSGSQYYNYKGYFSAVLLAIVDADYKFIAVDIGSSGSLSDGGVLLRSNIGQSLYNESLCLPGSKIVGSELLPHVIVGADAFPLKRNLMKPYPGKLLTVQQRIYNYRHSRARMVVENAFGILASRWRILHTSIHAKPEFVKLCMKTCVLLHNFLMSKLDTSGLSTTTLANLPASLEENKNVNEQIMPTISNQGSNNYSIQASEIREKFKDYFNGLGQVQWQNDMI